MRVRIVITPLATEIFIDSLPPPWREKPSITLLPITATRDTPEIKSTWAETSIHARAAAERTGYDEALLMNPSGGITEGAWSTFCILSPTGELFLPDESILPSVTLEVIEAKRNAKRISITKETLGNTSFTPLLLQSTSPITPVQRIGDYQYSAENPALSELLSLFEDSEIEHSIKVS